MGGRSFSHHFYALADAAHASFLEGITRSGARSSTSLFSGNLHNRFFCFRRSQL